MERTRPTAPPQGGPPSEDALPGLRPDRLAETPGPPSAGGALRTETGASARSEADAETVAEVQAREVWRVAARLQAEAARRLDARSQSLADEQRSEAAAAPEAAFSRDEVEEIARAAGILDRAQHEAFDKQGRLTGHVAGRDETVIGFELDHLVDHLFEDELFLVRQLVAQPSGKEPTGQRKWILVIISAHRERSISSGGRENRFNLGYIDPLPSVKSR